MAGVGGVAAAGARRPRRQAAAAAGGRAPREWRPPRQQSHGMGADRPGHHCLSSVPYCRICPTRRYAARWSPRSNNRASSTSRLLTSFPGGMVRQIKEGSCQLLAVLNTMQGLPFRADGPADMYFTLVTLQSLTMEGSLSAVSRLFD